MKSFYIAFFGVLGVFSRHYLGLGVGMFLKAPFPYGTFLVNLIGSFLIGIVYVLGVERATISQDLRAGLMVGYLGGFTTFSTYCLEVARLFEEGKVGFALVYSFLSAYLGLILVMGGMYVVRRY